MVYSPRALRHASAMGNRPPNTGAPSDDFGDEVIRLSGMFRCNVRKAGAYQFAVDGMTHGAIVFLKQCLGSLGATRISLRRCSHARKACGFERGRSTFGRKWRLIFRSAGIGPALGTDRAVLLCQVAMGIAREVRQEGRDFRRGCTVLHAGHILHIRRFASAKLIAWP